jgi:hypothetical protein
MTLGRLRARSMREGRVSAAGRTSRSAALHGRLGFEPSEPQAIEMTLLTWAPPAAAQMVRLSRYDPFDAWQYYLAASV